MPDEKKIKRSPWKYCRECKCEIQSTTGYCYDHWPWRQPRVEDDLNNVRYKANYRYDTKEKT